MIEIDNVTFRYKTTDAAGMPRTVGGVSHLTLSVAPGEFVVLAGDSGCGKTTVTRLINGLVPHYYPGELEGSVQVAGIDAAKAGIGELGAHVGSVFQNPRSQFFNVDTTSELAFAAENRCMEPDMIRENIRRVAWEMDIEALLDRRIFALSGGEKQKIACASVAVAGEEIIVLDEPSSNLDAEGIRELEKTLALWKSERKTVVIAEHRLYYLTKLADRLIRMKDGEIVEEIGRDRLRSMTQEEAYARGLRSLREVGLPERRTDNKTEAHDADRDFLICRNLSFHYKHSDHGIDFPELRFRRGAVTAIVGRNGAGKSTFARVLCGLEWRAKGQVFLDGVEWPRKKRAELCYSIMQDVNHQLFTDSVLEEVLLSMPERKGVTEKERVEAAREVLGRLDLLPLADTHPMALSGGQKQRVAIASGVVSGSPVLLFDEPTSGLDLGHMRQVGELLKLLREEGRTVLVITHDMELLREAADEVVRFGLK